MRAGLTVGLVVAGLMASTVPTLAGPWTDLCAAEAASRWEAGFETTGVRQYDLNTEAAITACQRANELEPSVSVTAWLARTYFIAGRAEEAQPLALSAALEGNILGKHIAGTIMTETGTDAEKAQGKAFLEENIAAGFVPSITTLGYNLEMGLAVAEDDAAALEQYRRSAELGDEVAMTNIGFFYRDALGGIEEDLPQSVEWFLKGATGGDPNGMDAMGYAYEHGLGVEQDLGESARWYMMSAAQGYSWGIADLAYAYDYGRGLEQDSARALELYEKAYDTGTRWAGVYIGKMYLEGIGVEQDIEKARVLIEEGLADDDFTAMYLMGRMFEDGLGVDKNLETALDWYKKAIDAGDTDDAPGALERVEAALKATPV
jgi:TPR repeat protein